jgi:hypothetical protein
MKLYSFCCTFYSQSSKIVEGRNIMNNSELLIIICFNNFVCKILNNTFIAIIFIHLIRDVFNVLWAFLQLR